MVIYIVKSEFQSTVYVQRGLDSHTYQKFTPLFKTALFEFIGLAKQNALMKDKDGLD